MQLLFTQPILATSSAHLISFAFALAYVGSLYLSKNARLSFVSSPESGDGDGRIPRQKQQEERWRDDPDVVRARIFAVICATVTCCLGVFVVMWARVGGTFINLDIAVDATLLRLGFWPAAATSNLFDIQFYLPHLVTPLLFLGPLFGTFLDGQLPGQKNWSWRTHVATRFFSIQGIRTYWAGPITEEIVFRACVLSTYHISGASKKRMIFFGPLTFGLAHAHHAWDTYNRYGRNAAAAKRAIIMMLFQLSYTTLFGIQVSYLFLRTGSVWPPITAHIFCNVMGLPEIAYELHKFKKWKWAIIVMYLAGIAGFVYAIPRWTLTKGNLYWALDGDDSFIYRKY